MRHNQLVSSQLTTASLLLPSSPKKNGVAHGVIVQSLRRRLAVSSIPVLVMRFEKRGGGLARWWGPSVLRRGDVLGGVFVVVGCSGVVVHTVFIGDLTSGPCAGSRVPMGFLLWRGEDKTGY